MHPLEDPTARKRAPRSGRWLTAALAAVMVVTLAASVYALVLAPPSRDLSTEAQAMERELAEREPRVIVLGNSSAKESVDDDALAEGLEVPVTTLWVPASKIPTWYATLKNRVFDNGYRPRLIVVPSILYSLLSTRPQNDYEKQLLLKQMGPEEPLIQSKAFGRSDLPLLLRVQRNGQQVREKLVWGAPHFALGAAAFAARGDRLVDGGRLHARSMERVFDLENAIAERLVVDRQGPSVGDELDLLPVEEGMVGDLIALAHDHDAAIVFVRVPPAPGRGARDPVGFEAQRDFVQLLNRRGAGFLDARSLRLGPNDYRDVFHLDQSGRRKLTDALLRMLDKWGGLGALSIPASPVPMAQPTLHRVGDAPADIVLVAEPTPHRTCTHEIDAPLLAPFTPEALADVGYAGQAPPVLLLESDTPVVPRAPNATDCRPGEFVASGSRVRFRPHGDEATSRAVIRSAPVVEEEGSLPWVLPGTSLDFEMARPWSEKGPLLVEVQAQPFGEAATETPATMRVTGTPPIELVGFGGRLKGTATLDAGPTGPWTIRVTSPPGGPWLAVHSIHVGRSPRRLRPLVAMDASGHMPMVPVTGPRLSRVDIEWPSDSLPMPEPHLKAPVVTTPGPGLGRIQLPEYAFLAGSCSPVALFEDGKLFKNQHRVTRRVHFCAQLPRWPGSTCHRDAGFVFSTNDGSDPVTNGRRYTLRLRRLPPFNVDNLCAGRFWILPGDTIRVRIPGASLAALHQGANLLTLAGKAYPRQGGLQSDLRVTVAAGGTIAGSRAIPAAALAHDVAVVPLRRVAPTAESVTLTIENPRNGPFVLLFRSTLVEASPVELSRTHARIEQWEDSRASPGP